jgi:tellurite resistance-related uncharacterized protein/truncated hemoglobin YjbI
VSASYAPTLREEWWWLQGQRLDTSALYQHLGKTGIREISTEFYGRVYADDVDGGWFRDMFKRRATMAQSIDRQAAFFCQMWGAPSKPYTASNKRHCLRALVGDHAGAKMFVMHEESRKHGDITPEGAARWWFHMDAALLKLRPSWCAKHGQELGLALEKTVRWFCDHVLERMVWGGPAKSPLAPPRLIFGIFKAITALYVQRRLSPTPTGGVGVGAMDVDFAARADLAPNGAGTIGKDDSPAAFSPAATILQLPPDVIPYKRLPPEGTFTVDTMPRGLLSRHNTKEAVWGEINVVKGRLQLNQLEGEIEEVVLSPPNSSIGVVAPTQYHVVKPLSDDLEMFIRFCAQPGTGPLASTTDGRTSRGSDGVQKPRRRDRGFG